MAEEVLEGAMREDIRSLTRFVQVAALEAVGGGGPKAREPGRPETRPNLRVPAHRVRNVRIGGNRRDLVLPEIEIALGELVEGGRIVAHNVKFSRREGRAAGACRIAHVRLRNRTAHARLSP
ncbi:MAG: hypothetical protein ING44_15135 [Telmatospirillum sp.]|nr:hypothetical protein [Telmatospirillum sp.]